MKRHKLNNNFTVKTLFVAIVILISFNGLAQDVHKFDFNDLSTGQYDKEAVKDALSVSFCNGADEGRVHISSAEGHGNVLDVKYPKGGVKTANSGMHTKVTFQDGKEHEELYMSYWIYFPADFEFRAGGKLPGLAYQTSERNMSLRLMWRYDGLVEYYVHYNTEPTHEDFKASINWSLIDPIEEPDGGPQPDQVKFKKGAWNHVELYYKLNTPGEKDGIMRGWLDGELAIDITDQGDYRQADEGDIKLNIIYLSTFFGGSDETFQPQNDVYAYFDDMLVSTSRIGYPGSGGEPGGVQPTVTITSPSNNSGFTAGDNITINATASDSDGSVSKVEFFNNGSKIGEDNSQPFSYTINSAAVGNYSLTAKAIDNENLSATSSAVSIIVTASSVPVTGVSLSPSSVSLLVGETNSLSATVLPSNATNKSVSYSSSNTSVATVNSSGVISAVSTGSATITVTTADGSKTDNCAVTVTSGGGGSGCDYLPMASALPNLNTSYENIFVTSSGPDLSNIRKFSINWSLTNNGLYTFAFNTNNGNPSWYVDMKSDVTHTLNSAQPSITVSGSGITGFDGEYYAIMDGENLVLEEKSGMYTIYFSKSSTAPDCDGFKSAQGFESELSSISIYPNPVTQNFITLDGLSESTVQVVITDMLGKTMLTETVNSNRNIIDVDILRPGSYILIIKGENTQTSKLFNKL